VAQPAADAIIFSIWKGKACGFGVSFGKLERLTGYAILWGLRRTRLMVFIMITEYISGFHLAFSRRCENRVFTADIQVGRINESRTIGIDFLPFCNWRFLQT